MFTPTATQQSFLIELALSTQPVTITPDGAATECETYPATVFVPLVDAGLLFVRYSDKLGTSYIDFDNHTALHNALSMEVTHD